MDLFKLVARLGIDSSEYEAGVKTALKSANQYKSDVAKMAAEFRKAGVEQSEAWKKAYAEIDKSQYDLAEKTEKATGKMKRHWWEFGKTAGEVSVFAGAKMVALGNFITQAVQKTASAVVSLGQTGLTYNQQMEDYTTNFKVMLGSMEAAEAKVDELKVMAAKTPFAMEDLADATQTLLAFGVQSTKTTSVMKQLGDISLGNAQRFSSLSNAYGKAAAQGKLTGEVVQMMVDAGFNPLLLIAQETGEAMTDLQDRMSRGAVSVDELDQALRRATSEGGQFYNGMEEASKTISGQLATLSDNWDALLGKAMEPASNQLSSKILPTAIESIDRLTNALFGTEDAADAAKKALFLGTEGNTIDPAQNLLTWYDDLMATWTDGKVEDTATVTQFVEEFNKNSESIKTALQTRINDLANPMTEEEMAAASAKITEISNMQTEIDQLLVKRAGGYFTAEDEARLKGIVEQLETMQLEVENSANFETNVVSPWEKLVGVLGEYSEDAITGITDFFIWTLENGKAVAMGLGAIGVGFGGMAAAAHPAAAAIIAISAGLAYIAANWEDVSATIGETTDTVKEIFTDPLGTATELSADAKENIDGLAGLLGNKLLGAVQNLGEQLGWTKEDADELLDVDTTEGEQGWENYGEAAEESLSGVQKWVMNVYSWTNRLNTALKNAGGSVGERTKTMLGFDTGLEYVPYNDFPARLHEGEAVLTKLEAQEWRAGGSASPQPASIDYEAMASAMVAALASSGIGFNVDSRQLAQATADANSRAQAQRNRYINIGKVRR